MKIEKSIIKATKELSVDETKIIYEIHKTIYGKFKTSIEFHKWASAINELYQNKYNKYIQIYYNFNIICGYNIFAGLIKINNKKYFKIIEGGVNRFTIISRNLTLRNMIDCLIRENNEKKVNWIIEIDYTYSKVINCFYACGFKIIKDENKIREYFDIILKGEDYFIKRKNNVLLINRNTRYRDNYQSIALIKET